jgi:hypothetical protein
MDTTTITSLLLIAIVAAGAGVAMVIKKRKAKAKKDDIYSDFTELTSEERRVYETAWVLVQEEYNMRNRPAPRCLVIRDINKPVAILGGVPFRDYRSKDENGNIVDAATQWGYAGLYLPMHNVVIANRGRGDDSSIQHFGSVLVHEMSHSLGATHGDDMYNRDSKIISQLKVKMGW